MSHAKLATLAASVAALALSIPGSAVAASDSAPTVFNFGHCQSTGFPYAQSGFGDGTYTVRELRDRHRRVGLEIDFLEDFRTV